MTAIGDLITFIRGTLARLRHPRGFGVECSVCRKRLSGPRDASTISHGYCWKHYWAQLRKIDESKPEEA